MQLNLNQLRAFYLAAKGKNITKAAETLFVTQPAVSMQIKGLEDALSLKLLRKRGKNIELTDAGRVLFGYAQRIFEIVGEMEYVMKGFADLRQGSLTIGTTRSFARHLMPGLLSRFQERFPGVRVYLRVGSSQEVADAVMEFKYDLGVVGRLPFPNKLRMVPYSKEEFCLVTPPKHRFATRAKVSVKELKNEPIIIRESGSGSRHAILSFLEVYGVTPEVLVEAGSVEFIKEYIMKGRGVSFLYRPEVQLETDLGLLVPVNLEEGPILISTDIVFPEEVELSPATRAFLGMIESPLN
jgi:DNA-binding transcriptional LysR family regulator